MDMATLRPGLHQTRWTSGPCPKVWPPCSFSNKEPSKTSVWLPCSGHVQEQKRLPPWLANDSTCGLQGSRLPWGFMLRACLCGVRARVHAGSCHEANMTLSDCLCHACLCLCCMRARVCAESCHGKGRQPPCSGEPPEQLDLLIHHLLLVPRGRGGCWARALAGGGFVLRLASVSLLGGVS